jgi:(p)ppGpp synthase/HD superfamily hydrolase
MKDVRCLLLKIFDRNHNLKGLNEKKPKDQIKKCFETQAIYHPIKIVIGYTDKSKNWRENSKIFNQFLKDNKSKSAKELKEFLYEIAFANISKDLFELTKNDPQNIIRKIQDKKLFEELLQIPNLDEKVKILNMECDRNGEFMVTFQYLKLEIIETNGKNLFLHGFNV